MRVLAADLGASSGRICAVNLENGRLSINEVHRFHTPVSKHDGLERWDLIALIREVQRGIEKAGPAASLGVDSWGVDFGLLCKNGSLIADPIRYRDASHIPGAEELKRRFDVRFAKDLAEAFDVFQVGRLPRAHGLKRTPFARKARQVALGVERTSVFELLLRFAKRWR